MTTAQGWAETSGGGMLASLIADAFARAEQHDHNQARSETQRPASDDVGTDN